VYAVCIRTHELFEKRRFPNAGWTAHEGKHTGATGRSLDRPSKLLQLHVPLDETSIGCHVARPVYEAEERPAEPARHALYSELERVIGTDNARTLMMYLPAQPADEVATKADIARLEARFDRFETRFEARLDQMQRTYMVTVVASMTALTGIFSLVVGFLG
jgi:hypothetical protein